MMTALSPNDEISSTEKLLDVIRGEGGPSAGLSDNVDIPNPSRTRRVHDFFKVLPFFRKHITIGVEIGPTNLIMVKMVQLSESRCKLLDYKTVAFKPEAPRRSPDFCEFLRSAIVEFCGPPRNVRIWSSLSTAQVDVRQIRIPKVAKKELFNAIFWTAKREMNFDEKDSIFDFELQGEVIEDGIAKMRVMAYSAPKDAVKEITDLFSRSGLTLAGVTIAPFAIQNLFRANWLPVSDRRTYANLYLSDAYSRIAIFSQGNLILTREIKTGVDSLIISLVESFSNTPEELPLDAAGMGELPPSLDDLEKRLDALEHNWERARAMLFDHREGDPRASQEKAGDQLEEDEIVELVRPAVQRLIRQIERTLEYYSRLVGSEQVERLFISGEANFCGAIIDDMSQSLGIKTEIMDPLNPAQALLTSVAPPPSTSARTPYTSALGLALSDNSRTPNLLFTFHDKEREAAVARINRSIFVVFMSIILILVGVYVWQEYLSRQKTAEISKLRQELAQFSPAVDQNLLMQLAARVKSQEQGLKEKARKVLGIAVVSELSALTPANIKLSSITVDLGGIPEPQTKEATPGQTKNVSRSLVIDGIVQGESQTLEASLARYLMKLGASPMFINPNVHSSTLETYQEVGEVLHFILKMGLI
jgi:type IV pilus assembly protein PilM